MDFDSQLVLCFAAFGKFFLDLIKIFLQLFCLVFGLLNLSRLPLSAVCLLLFPAKIQQRNFQQHGLGGFILLSEYLSFLDFFFDLNLSEFDGFSELKELEVGGGDEFLELGDFLSDLGLFFLGLLVVFVGEELFFEDFLKLHKKGTILLLIASMATIFSFYIYSSMIYYWRIFEMS